MWDGDLQVHNADFEATRYKVSAAADSVQIYISARVDTLHMVILDVSDFDHLTFDR